MKSSILLLVVFMIGSGIGSGEYIFSSNTHQKTGKIVYFNIRRNIFTTAKTNANFKGKAVISSIFIFENIY